MVRDNTDFGKSLYLAEHLLYVVPLLLSKNKRSEMRFLVCSPLPPLPLPISVSLLYPSINIWERGMYGWINLFRTDNPSD